MAGDGANQAVERRRGKEREQVEPRTTRSVAGKKRPPTQVPPSLNGGGQISVAYRDHSCVQGASEGQ